MRQSLLKSATLFFLLFITNAVGYAQGEGVKGDAPDRDWRIEIEPSAFVLHGYGLQVSRNVSKDNRFNIGVYSDLILIPNWAKKGLFNNVPDNSEIGLFKVAFVARYKFKLGKKESNPYIGILSGWENFELSVPEVYGTAEFRITTAFVSPNIGYELYFYRERWYINPQASGIFYIGAKNNTPGRTESMKSFFLLPAIALGVRL